MLDEALRACYHESDTESDIDDAGDAEGTPSLPLELGAVEELEALHSELSLAPESALAQVSPRMAAAIQSGARINVTAIGSDALIEVEGAEAPSARTPQPTLAVEAGASSAVDYGALISPTVASLIADEAEWQKANAALVEELTALREKVAHLQAARSGMSKALALKSQAYVELQTAFDRVSADRLALIREDRAKQQRIENLIKVIQTAVRVLNGIMQKPFNEITAIISRLQRALSNVAHK